MFSIGKHRKFNILSPMSPGVLAAGCGLAVAAPVQDSMRVDATKHPTIKCFVYRDKQFMKQPVLQVPTSRPAYIITFHPQA